MEINIKNVSNGYVIEYNRTDLYGDTESVTAVQMDGDELKKFIGGLIVKELSNRLYDGENELTVKVEDSFDTQQPRGKQRWINENFGCWYVQTTGIWKTVWSEEEKLNYASTPMFMIEAVKPEIETKKRVTSYWSKRSDDFMKHKRAELHSVQAERWMNEIHRFLPAERPLKILDIGCGAGFFSILLAKEGHQVTGVDLTPDMVERARFLALEEGISEDIAEGSCRFMVMDAENPEFADESFDVVISRNLTWTLPHADRAYEQWIRVLKKGGCLINADADYGADNFADTSALPKSHVHHMVGNELMEECETIKQLMSISECRRPAWDVQALKYFGMEEVQADTELSSRLYKEKDEFYNPTPMFLVYGKKKR